MRFVILAGAFAAALSGPVSAATFSPDTATASSQFSTQYAPIHTINGSGLGGVGNFGPGDRHANYSTNNHWTTAASTNPLDQWIQWGFDAPTTIGGLWIWNHLSNIIASNAAYEPTLFSLTFRDAADDVIASFTNIPLSPQPASNDPDFGQSQAFTLADVLTGVSSVRFDVDDKESPLTGSTAYTGLAEVLFSAERISGATVIGTVPQVPLPAGLPLMATALGVFAALRVRKRAIRV